MQQAGHGVHLSVGVKDSWQTLSLHCVLTVSSSYMFRDVIFVFLSWTADEFSAALSYHTMLCIVFCPGPAAYCRTGQDEPCSWAGSYLNKVPQQFQSWTWECFWYSSTVALSEGFWAKYYFISFCGWKTFCHSWFKQLQISSDHLNQNCHLNWPDCVFKHRQMQLCLNDLMHWKHHWWEPHNWRWLSFWWVMCQPWTATQQSAHSHITTLTHQR